MEDETRPETDMDLSEEELIERYVTRYRNGDPIIINGRTVTPEKLERIRITRSEEESEQIIQRLKMENRNSPVAFIGGPSYKTQAAGEGEDVTDDFIQNPPGHYTEEEASVQSEKLESSDEVFVVHGHDHELKHQTEVFLHDINLEPVVLHREPDEGLTIIEKFEQYSEVQFALILLTPDDVGCSIDDFDEDDPADSLQPRARQNVIFEAGYFVGELGRSNVCLLYQEGVQLPSDLDGLLYKEVKSSVEDVGYDLIKEFQEAGLDVQISD